MARNSPVNAASVDAAVILEVVLNFSSVHLVAYTEQMGANNRDLDWLHAHVR